MTVFARKYWIEKEPPNRSYWIEKNLQIEVRKDIASTLRSREYALIPNFRGVAREAVRFADKSLTRSRKACSAARERLACGTADSSPGSRPGC